MAMSSKINYMKWTVALLIAVLAVGCTYDEPDVVRTSSDVAYKYACSRFEAHLTTHMNKVHTILSAEHWASLESDSARYAYEDKHFKYIRIRKADDGIVLIDSKGIHSKITGNGVPFGEQGASRTYNNLTITTLYDNTYSVVCDFSEPSKYNIDDSPHVEKFEWTVYHKADFSTNTEMLNITDGTGGFQDYGLKLRYHATNLMCEVSCWTRYEWQYSRVNPFHGSVSVEALSAVMEAEHADPDRFSVTYQSSVHKQISY